MDEASRRSGYMPLSGAASGRPWMINLVSLRGHRQILLATFSRPKSTFLQLTSAFHATRGRNLGLGHGETRVSFRLTRAGGKPGKPGRSEHGEVAAQLVLGDLAAVLLPLLALVAQEEVEDVLPQRLGDELAVLHGLDGLVQILRQGPDAERAALGGGQRPHVVFRAGRQ